MAVPVPVYIVFSKSLWAYGSALGGAVVIRGHTGDIPRLSVDHGV